MHGQHVRCGRILVATDLVARDETELVRGSQGTTAIGSRLVGAYPGRVPVAWARSIWCLSTDVQFKLTHPDQRSAKNRMPQWMLQAAETVETGLPRASPKSHKIAQVSKKRWRCRTCGTGSAGTRTQDPRLKRPLLYRLSYAPGAGAAAPRAKQSSRRSPFWQAAARRPRPRARSRRLKHPVPVLPPGSCPPPQFARLAPPPIALPAPQNI